MAEQGIVGEFEAVSVVYVNDQPCRAELVQNAAFSICESRQWHGFAYAFLAVEADPPEQDGIDVLVREDLTERLVDALGVGGDCAADLAGTFVLQHGDLVIRRLLVEPLQQMAEQRVKFGAVKLLRRAPVEDTQKHRLRELLLLALRVATLMLLAFAFARLQIPTKSPRIGMN